MSNVLPPKKDVANALLERSSMFIHMDPRAARVVVPAQFKKAPQLVLQVGLNMPIPIPDLEVDDAGIRCTLSFSRTPFYCIVPWAAIYALVGDDGRGMVWPDDVPPEVARQARAEAPKGRSPGSVRPAPGPPASVRPAPGPRAPRGRSNGKSDGAAKREPSRSRRPRKPSVAPPAGDVRTKLVALSAAPGSSEPATPPAATPGRKPRRELPPYLRVVK